jgi:hypothetical protein
MTRNAIALALTSASLNLVLAAAPAANPVIDWNRTLLTIVRTAGAQPPTIHTTRSFAILHAAIFDAVNSISRAYNPYLIQIEGTAPSASKESAAAAAAHEVLINLYPGFQSLLDTQLEQSLASVADEAAKAEGVQIGQMVANRILLARSQDGANAPQVPFIFGTAPGDYQSTPPNFPKQPQLTQWPGVTPFALEKASQFRPGPPPALTSDTYTNSFNEVKSLGISNSATATPDQAVTGRFWNGAIQNYWNEIAQTAALDRKLKTAETARLFALRRRTPRIQVRTPLSARRARACSSPSSEITLTCRLHSKLCRESRVRFGVSRTPPGKLHSAAYLQDSISGSI